MGVVGSSRGFSGVPRDHSGISRGSLGVSEGTRRSQRRVRGYRCCRKRLHGIPGGLRSVPWGLRDVSGAFQGIQWISEVHGGLRVVSGVF